MAVVAVPVLSKLMHPMYHAEAMIMVSPTAKSLGGERESSLPRYTEFVNQQMLLIAREDVSLEALEHLGDRRSVWKRNGENAADAAARLSGALRVSRVPETSYFSVGIDGSSPEGLVEIVDAVVKVFLDKARDQSLSGTASGRRP
jgi:uncharacterized protein involved in exopolysaccharide biosynthesis